MNMEMDVDKERHEGAKFHTSPPNPKRPELQVQNPFFSTVIIIPAAPDAGS